MNRVILHGRLGDNPDLRYTGNGTAVANLSIATNRRKKEGDNWVDVTDWHRVVVWARRAEVANEYLQKGSPVIIEGHLETRKWQDQQGNDRYTTEVICENLELVGGSRQGSGNRSDTTGRRSSGPATEGPPADDFDDDIPF